MAAPTETEPMEIDDESAAEGDQESRIKRYDQRIEEWLTSLKEGAEQRSPEVLGALATRAKDVGDYLDKLADKARSRNESSAAVGTGAESFDDVPAGGDEGRAARGYRGPDPESDHKGDADHEEQGTQQARSAMRYEAIVTLLTS